jgi:hypothetical protein
LLDNLFSFLRRKTDFFTGATPQMVEELVLKAVRKHEEISAREEAEKKKQKEREEKLKRKKLEEQKKKEEEERKAKLQQDEDVLELNEDGTFDASAKKNECNPAINSTTSLTSTVPLEKVGEADIVAEPATESEIVGEKMEEDEEVAPPPGNGGRTDKYVWTQQLSELTVNVPVPAGTKGKQLDIDISNRRLRVGLKGQAPIVSGELHKRVIVDDSFWTLVDNEVVLNLQKENKMEWWKSVIVGDPEINTQKVQPENSKLSDLDGETRQTVEKMMFDQRQKALGLPSADELQKQEMLKKFMAAHPEMDFSKAKFS